MSSAKICLIYDFHRHGAFEVFNLERYRRAAVGLGDFTPVFHQSGPYSVASSVKGAVTLTDAEIFGGVKHRKGKTYKIIPGNRDLKMLAAARKLPGYDFYIAIEYDVVFLGDPRAAMELLVAHAVTADLGASFFARDYQDGWMWWDSLAAPQGSDVDLSVVATSSFLPLVSFSRRFAQAAEARLGQGWRGHQEALWPTIAALDGLTTLDFAETRPRITCHAQFGAHAPQAVSLEDSLFAHPVKNTAQFHDLLRRAGLPAI
jgi:hypothetical protein